MRSILLSKLQTLVSKECVALRSKIQLYPIGGQESKIFPPTYINELGKPVYALERRRVTNDTSQVVLLDSVASQARRAEEILLKQVKRCCKNTVSLY